MIKKFFSRKKEATQQSAFDTATAFQSAMQYHQSGDLAQAGTLYQQILQHEPNHVDALHFSGVLAHQRGQNQTAIELISKVAQFSPNSSAIYANLGLVFQAQGNLQAAVESYQKALSLQPDFMQAYFSLGNIFHAQGQLNEAIENYLHVIKLNPNFAIAHHALGVALQTQGKIEEAIASYRQAIAIQADLFDAYLNLGYLFIAQNNAVEAIDCYQHLLALKPDYAEGYCQLANLFYAQNEFKQAEENYQKAVYIKPDYFEALNNLGMTFQAQGNFSAAFESYQGALAINPNSFGTYAALGSLFQDQNKLDQAIENYQKSLKLNADCVIYNNLGQVYSAQGNLEAAEKCFRNALSLKSDVAGTYFNLGNSLYFQRKLEGAIENYQKTLMLQPNHHEARDMLFYSQLNCCDWSSYTDSREKIIEAVKAGQYGYAPFSFLAVSDNALVQQLCATTYTAKKYPLAKELLADGQKYSHKKIRIAYVSGDFRPHPISHLMAGLFELHDKERFETIAIALKPEDKSSIGQRVKHAFSQFINVVDKSDYEIAVLMRELEIDIAVDLMGFTSNRIGIFAYRPAPVQISYLGSPATMGVSYIDYIFADAFAIPSEYQQYYTEKVAYLPECFQVNDDKRVISPKKITRVEMGLPEAGVVFCSFNNAYKITPIFFDMWMRLLKAVPNSVLWLLSDNPLVQANLRGEAMKRGVASERLIFAKGMENTEHLARFQLADLFLDTLPVNAGATASDALWVGVPIVTCAGEALASRMAGSLLYGIGLPELVTYSLEEYEALALKLATTPTLLTEIREKLAHNRTSYPLFNTDRFRWHIEAAYTTMWQHYQQGKSPASFRVPLIE
jgi:predicted O-linked N-acetylglucosamine transferase (SPINDLY family)